MKWDIDRILELCNRHSVDLPTSAIVALMANGAGMHAVLDRVDGASGVATGGGVIFQSGKTIPCNYVGTRIALHEAEIRMRKKEFHHWGLSRPFN